MNPMYLILFAIVVTLVLTLAIPSLQGRELDPRTKRGLWLSLAAGIGLLLALIAYTALR